MMNSLDLSFAAYKNARCRLDKALEDYSKLCLSQGANTVVLFDDAEPFASLNESIFWALSIFDLVEKKIGKGAFNGICQFTSALRLIVNAMKHNADVFVPSTKPGYTIAVGVQDGEKAPIITDVKLTPTILFADLEGINLKDKNDNKINNYNRRIKGHKLSEIMEELDSTVELLDSKRKQKGL